MRSYDLDDDSDDDVEEDGDDEFADGDEEDDEAPTPDPHAHLEEVERGYRADRARIRACDDVHELRAMKAEYEAILRRRVLSEAGRVRAGDLIELIDDRITDLRARAGGSGRA